MNSEPPNLALHISEELKETKQLLERIQEVSQKLEQSVDPLYVESLALNLHGFYNGLERIFLQIATHIDRTLPKGSNWHQELLNQMHTELPTVRPAVISQNTLTSLKEYRGFRHVVRNVNPLQLDIDKVKPLALQAESVFTQVSEELLAFVDFLEGH